MVSKEYAMVHLGCGTSSLLPMSAYNNSLIKLIVVDINPSDELKKIAAEVIELSVEETGKILQSLTGLSARYEIIGAYPVADYANLTCAAINTKFSGFLANSEAIKKMADKVLSYQVMQGEGIRTPETYLIDTQKKINANQFLFKKHSDSQFIIKPRYGHDSKDTCLIQLSQVTDFFLEGLPKNEYLLQEYISGELFNIDYLILKNQVMVLSINKRFQSKLNRVRTVFTIQGNLDYDLSSKAQEIGEMVSKGFDYQNGPMTIDLIKDSFGNIYILEASPFFHKPWLNFFRGTISPFMAVAEAYLFKNFPLVANDFLKYDELLGYELIKYADEPINDLSKFLIKHSIRSFTDDGWKKSNSSKISSAMLGVVKSSVFPSINFFFE